MEKEKKVKRSRKKKVTIVDLAPVTPPPLAPPPKKKRAKKTATKKTHSYNDFVKEHWHKVNVPHRDKMAEIAKMWHAQKAKT